MTTTRHVHEPAPSAVGSASNSSFTDFFPQPPSPPPTTGIETKDGPRLGKKEKKELLRIRELDNSFPAPLTPPPIQSDLPRPALRALFALRHAAESFVTRENLDAAIDAAFARSNQLTTMVYRHRSEWKLSELEEEVDKIRSADGVTDDMRHLRDLRDREERRQKDFITQRTLTYNTPVLGPRGRDQVSSWAHTKAESRELAVRAALYGVEPIGKRTKPGLDAVEEHLAVTEAKTKAVKRADKAYSGFKRRLLLKSASEAQDGAGGRRPSFYRSGKATATEL